MLSGENYPENIHPKTPDNEIYVKGDAFLSRMTKKLLKWKININKIAGNSTSHTKECSFPNVARIIKLYKITQQFSHHIDKKGGVGEKTNNCGA